MGHADGLCLYQFRVHPAGGGDEGVMVHSARARRGVRREGLGYVEAVEARRDPVTLHGILQPMLRTHAITIRVRYSECDPMGVAHHSAYAPWFEMGRTELLRASAANGMDYRQLEAQGVLMAVARLEIR